MSTLSIQERCQTGAFIGAGVALIPGTATLLIASSRIIFVNILANSILRVLTGGHVGITVHGMSLIQVPFLWKVSKISLIAGTSIAGLSGTVFLIHKIYQKLKSG